LRKRRPKNVGQSSSVEGNTGCGIRTV